MILADPDTWTCRSGVTVYGIWTSPRYAAGHGSGPFGVRWCRTVNPTTVTRCRRCNRARHDGGDR